MVNNPFPATPGNKKKLWLVLACTIVSPLIIFLLYIVSDKVNHRPNGFIRLFPPHPVTPEKILDVKYNSWYIAGATKDRIYLGNATAPVHLLTTNYALTDTVHMRLQIQDTSIRVMPLVHIDSPHIYMTEPFTSVIQYGTLPNLTVRPLPDTSFFYSAAPMTPGSFIYRSYDTLQQQSILLKHTSNSARELPAPGALEKQVDGFFCTDGALHYEPATARLVYVYYYRNRIVSLDTNMNILYKSRTIDTTSQVKIKVAHVASTGKITIASPPAMVNRLSCVDSNWIYVNSKLAANNENMDLFNKCSVVDVYSLKDGKYHFSFYLPDMGTEKVRSFRVFNKTLVALYDHYVYTYKLNF